MGGCWILLEKFLNRVDYIDILATSTNTNGKTHATIFIHNIQKLQSSAIHRLVELEVDRSHMMRVLGSKVLSGTVCRS
jgi:hypothetical protein